jgi:hypothetical protein
VSIPDATSRASIENRKWANDSRPVASNLKFANLILQFAIPVVATHPHRG